MTPTLASSLRLSAAAFWREAWLAAPGLLVTLARRAASWPAIWAGGALLLRATLSAAARRPFTLSAPLDAALAMVTSPRFLGIVGGLWLVGALLSAALRVAWISGAVPVLGSAMAGQPRGAAGFAEGVAGGFARVLPAALLGFVLELSGALFAGTLALGTALLVAHGGAPGAAAAAALALTLSLAVPLALSTTADALIARAALLGEGAATALAAVVRRFLSRPGAFLLGALAFGVAGWAAQLSVRAVGGMAAGLMGSAPTLVRLGPQLLVGALAALAAGVVDLFWLGTLAVLTCGRER